MSGHAHLPHQTPLQEILWVWAFCDGLTCNMLRICPARFVDLILPALKVDGAMAKEEWPRSEKSKAQERSCSGQLPLKNMDASKKTNKRISLKGILQYGGELPSSLKRVRSPPFSLQPASFSCMVYCQTTPQKHPVLRKRGPKLQSRTATQYRHPKARKHSRHTARVPLEAAGAEVKRLRLGCRAVRSVRSLSLRGEP